MAHIGLYDRQPELVDHPPQFRSTPRICRHLRLEVGDVLIRVPARVGMIAQQIAQRGVTKAPVLDQQEVIDQHAFFVHCRCAGRHRTGRDAPHIRMVPARGGPEQDLVALEHRRHDRDVRQVGAAIVRRVQRKDIAGAHAPCVLSDDRLDRAVHAAQMHRHMRRIGDERPVAVEHRA